jgi:hypothetical protein
MLALSFFSGRIEQIEDTQILDMMKIPALWLIP